jgi:hypothetical protein
MLIATIMQGSFLCWYSLLGPANPVHLCSPRQSSWLELEVIILRFPQVDQQLDNFLQAACLAPTHLPWAMESAGGYEDARACHTVLPQGAQALGMAVALGASHM